MVCCEGARRGNRPWPNYARDEGRLLDIALQGKISNHRQRLGSQSLVVSVTRCRKDRDVIETETRDFARMVNPIVRGWMQYYGRCYPSALYSVLRHLDRMLVRGVEWKDKKWRVHTRRTEHWLAPVRHRDPGLFVPWQHGRLPVAGRYGSRMS